MIVEEFSFRLKKAMEIKRMKAAQLSKLTGIKPPLISDYLSGKYKAKQDKVYLLAKALNVNEAWLMGYDVPMDRIITEKTKSDILRDKIENLSDLQKDAIIQIIDNMK